MYAPFRPSSPPLLSLQIPSLRQIGCPSSSSSPRQACDVLSEPIASGTSGKWRQSSEIHNPHAVRYLCMAMQNAISLAHSLLLFIPRCDTVHLTPTPIQSNRKNVNERINHSKEPRHHQRRTTRRGCRRPGRRRKQQLRCPLPSDGPDQPVIQLTIPNQPSFLL
jgi:hypothetical protein